MKIWLVTGEVIAAINYNVKRPADSGTCFFWHCHAQACKDVGWEKKCQPKLSLPNRFRLFHTVS
jgi:uncharacterized protein (UPF0179 family)